ncbi:hypothetical protein RIF29_32714 [Crotalaria pallida]|uniref:Uncharacterized protein n=1 Tax=Crotalaria pallida TaxID=3830 RepID=A0AAN9EII4_CROPI
MHSFIINLLFSLLSLQVGLVFYVQKYLQELKHDQTKQDIQQICRESSSPPPPPTSSPSLSMINTILLTTIQNAILKKKKKRKRKKSSSVKEVGQASPFLLLAIIVPFSYSQYL